MVGRKDDFGVRRKDVIMTCGKIQVRSENVYSLLRTIKKYIIQNIGK